jgi:hypothetical protein
MLFAHLKRILRMDVRDCVGQVELGPRSKEAVSPPMPSGVLLCSPVT